MNPITKYVRDRLIEPATKQEIGRLKKELGRAQSKLEEKSFDLLTTFNPGSKAQSWDYDVKKLTREYISWAYANITVIAEKVASMDLELFTMDSKGELTEVDRHELLDLLHRVNDYQTKWDLIYTAECHLLAQGEAVWYLMGKANEMSKPTEIWPLRPEYIKIVPGNLANNEFIKSYEYRLPGQQMVTFEPWEILFFKNPHPNNMYRGYGVLEAAITDVLIDYHANEYNKSFFGNFAQPDGVLSTESRLTDEVVARLDTQWKQKFEGPKNAGKTAILEQGLKYEKISQSAKDMDFIQQQTWTRDKLMAMFKNTKTILGITEDVNRANAEASEASWLKHNIKPKMERIVDYINEFLVPVYGSNLVLGFCDPVPENTEQDYAQYKMAVDMWLTRNEIREELGLDPVEGGDFLFVPFTQAPISTVSEKPQDERDAEANAAAAEANNNNDQPVDEEQPKYFMTMKAKRPKKHRKRQLRYAPAIKVLKQRQFREKMIQEQVAKAMKEMTFKNLKAKVKGLQNDGRLSNQTKQGRWELFVKLAGIFETNMKRVVESVINKHAEITIRNLANYRPKAKVNKSANDFLPSDESFVKISIDALTPIIRELIRQQGQDSLDFLGSPLRFDFNKTIAESIRRFVSKASDTYIKTVRERIAELITKGVQEGWSVQKMQQEVRATYTAMSRDNALRLARTETIRASNFATEQAFIQSQVVTGKEWFTALDERVCPYCEEMDGKIFDVEATIFDKGDELTVDGNSLSFDYGDVEYPPLHPSCRCTISPVILNKSLNSRVKKLKKQVEDNPSLLEAEKLIESKIALSKQELEKRMTDLETEMADSVTELVKAINDED